MVAEIQKLGQILAKILRLKNDGNVDEGLGLAFQALSDNFSLTKEYLETASVEDFQLFLKANQYSAEKLNLLAQLLFETVYPFQDEKETALILHKTAAILNLLETEYHQQSFENIARRDQITNFLNNQQYE